MEFFNQAGTKTFLGLCCAVFAAFWRSVTELFIVLLVVLILDYVTGIVNGLINKGFSFDKAWKGIIKKVMYGPVLVLGFTADYMIFYLANAGGLDLGFMGMFSIAVSVYLIGTEGFSIIQNLIQIGVPAPEFLLKAFGLMRDNAGKLVKLSEVSNNVDSAG